MVILKLPWLAGLATHVPILFRLDKTSSLMRGMNMSNIFLAKYPDIMPIVYLAKFIHRGLCDLRVATLPTLAWVQTCLFSLRPLISQYLNLSPVPHKFNLYCLLPYAMLLCPGMIILNRVLLKIRFTNRKVK